MLFFGLVLRVKHAKFRLGVVLGNRRLSLECKDLALSVVHEQVLDGALVLGLGAAHQLLLAAALGRQVELAGLEIHGRAVGDEAIALSKMKRATIQRRDANLRRGALLGRHGLLELLSLPSGHGAAGNVRGKGCLDVVKGVHGEVGG